MIRAGIRLLWRLFGDTVTTLSASTIDLRTYKALSRNNMRELIVRFVILNIAGVYATILFGDPVFIQFSAIYSITQISFLIALYLGPDLASLSYAVLVYGLGFVVFAAIMAIADYLWFTKGETGKVMALLLIYSAMLNSISLRMREPIVSRLEVSTICVAVLVLVFGTLWTESNTPMAWGKAFGLVSSLGYFLLAVSMTINTNKALEDARQSEVQRARMEGIGQITGGVAHDFNNLLTVIRGNLELRKEIIKNGGSVQEGECLLNEVDAAVERATQTTQQLLSYSRRAALKATNTDLRELVDNVKPLLMHALPASVRLDVCPGEPLPGVMVDRTQLENVLLNLVINARDAMPEGGEISIDLTHLSRPSSNNWVILSVRDTGEGMSEAVLDRVSEPYFTTKPVGKGSGLGLAMAKGFAEQSGGAMEIESRIGVGTTIRLTLPVVQE